MGEHIVECFPFDSDPDGYDEYGYPVYDRAVSARTYRYSLQQFFSDGVFGTPANALQIGKGSGLNVTVQPGIGIIRGAIGGVFDEAATLQLDIEPPQGNVAYSIMLRCDDNDDRRGMFLYVEKGNADANPVPPYPVETNAIKDLRLGYVIVPSGATDLSNATVTNEKGLDVCPYAAPFAEIDMSDVTADARNSSNEALSKLLEYFEMNESLVDSAIDGTTAGYLQTQISQLQQQVENFDLSNSVDNETVEYTMRTGDIEKKLRVMDGGISEDKISEGAVTESKILGGAVSKDKLSALLQNELGIFDTSTIDTADELMYLYNNGGTTEKQQAVSVLLNLSWADIASCVYQIEPQYLQQLVGSTKNVVMSSYGTVPFVLIGVDHDQISDEEGNARLTFQASKILYKTSVGKDNADWPQTTAFETVESNVLQMMQDPGQSLIKTVTKTYVLGATLSEGDVSNTSTYSAKTFIAGQTELGLSPITPSAQDGTIYEYFAPQSDSNSTKRVRQFNGEADYWFTSACSRRSGVYHYWSFVNGDGGSYKKTASYADFEAGIVPCFCI